MGKEKIGTKIETGYSTHVNPQYYIATEQSKSMPYLIQHSSQGMKVCHTSDLSHLISKATLIDPSDSY